jgi:hypothetical protein
MMIWKEFTDWRGELPTPKRHVLVAIAATEPEPVDLKVSLRSGTPTLVSSAPPGVMVGYMKFAAGDRDCPYFVIPGGPPGFRVTHWCDCLGDDFSAPCWMGTQRVTEPLRSSAPYASLNSPIEGTPPSKLGRD